MKFLAIALLFSAIGLSLPTCSGTNVTIDPTAVISAAQTACAFEPTAATVINVVTNNPSLTTAEAVAAAICSALQTVKTGEHRGVTSGDHQVTVYVAPNGVTVPIIGHYTK